MNLDVTTFSLVCSIMAIVLVPCIFTLLVYDFRYNQWRNSPDEVWCNTGYILASIVLSGMTAAILTMFWPVTLVAVVAVGIAYGVAHSFKIRAKR